MPDGRFTYRYQTGLILFAFVLSGSSTAAPAKVDTLPQAAMITQIPN
jgi:hypothetical protein